jgi:hypothetical protein
MGDLVDDLEAEGSPLSLRAARYIRIKRTMEALRDAQHRKVSELLYDSRPNELQHRGGENV